jgi:hypothetical protein
LKSFFSINALFNLESYPESLFEYLNQNRLELKDVSNCVGGLTLYESITVFTSSLE